MTTPVSGGLAFPTSPEESRGKVASVHGGMTLRDWFAGQALIGLISQCRPPAVDNKNFDDFAEWSYEMADAMLKAGKEFS